MIRETEKNTKKEDVIKKLPEVVFFQEGPGVRKEQFTSTGVKLFNVGNLQRGKVNLSKTKVFISEELAYGKYNHFLVDEGDLLIACSGITVDKFEDKVAFVNTRDLPLCMNTSTMRFKSLNPKELDIRYFAFFLKSSKFKEQVRRLITGSAQLNFGPSHIEQMTIPIPSLKIQKQVIDVLTEVELLLEKRRQSIAKLDQLTQSLFIDMFCDSASPWSVVKIGDLAADVPAAMRSGPFGSDLLHSEFVDKGIAVLGIDNVVSNEFKWDKRRYITLEKYEELKRYTIRPGDVLISIMATLGRSCVVPDDIPAAINTKHLAALTLDQSKVLPEFLSKAFLFHPDILAQLKTSEKGAIMAGLNLGIIKGLKFKLPPLELQNKYVKQVIKIKNLKSTMTYSQNHISILFNSISAKYFTEA